MQASIDRFELRIVRCDHIRVNHDQMKGYLHTNDGRHHAIIEIRHMSIFSDVSSYKKTNRKNGKARRAINGAVYGWD